MGAGEAPSALAHPRKSGEVPLIGRGDESAALAAAVARVTAGLGAVVVIEGEAGIGKTRLVQEAREVAAAAGIEVCAGPSTRWSAGARSGCSSTRCASAGRSSARPTTNPGPRLPGCCSARARRCRSRRCRWTRRSLRVGEAVVDVVERVCARCPLLLVLEDLHWADPSTVSCLARLGRICGQLPLLVVVTARPSPRSAGLARLLDGFAERGAVRLGLGPLGPADLRALAEAVVGSPSGPNLQRNFPARVATRCW